MGMIYKYSTHILTAFTACLCAWAALNWDSLVGIQRATAVFAVLITLHEWEEMHWPGGFMEMMAGMVGWDMSGVRKGAEHTSQAAFIVLLMALSMAFPDAHWIFCSVMVLGIFEGLIHVAGIKLARTERPYTPGLVTAELMLVACIASIALVSGEADVTALDWVLGAVFFLVWFFLMQQLLIALCGFDRRESMRGMREMFKSRVLGRG